MWIKIFINIEKIEKSLYFTYDIQYDTYTTYRMLILYASRIFIIMWLVFIQYIV